MRGFKYCCVGPRLTGLKNGLRAWRRGRPGRPTKAPGQQPVRDELASLAQAMQRMAPNNARTTMIVQQNVTQSDPQTQMQIVDWITSDLGQNTGPHLLALVICATSTRLRAL